LPHALQIHVLKGFGAALKMCTCTPTFLRQTGEGSGYTFLAGWSSLPHGPQFPLTRWFSVCARGESLFRSKTGLNQITLRPSLCNCFSKCVLALSPGCARHVRKAAAHFWQARQGGHMDCGHRFLQGLGLLCNNVYLHFSQSVTDKCEMQVPISGRLAHSAKWSSAPLEANV